MKLTTTLMAAAIALALGSGIGPVQAAPAGAQPLQINVTQQGLGLRRLPPVPGAVSQEGRVARASAGHGRTSGGSSFHRPLLPRTMTVEVNL